MVTTLLQPTGLQADMEDQKGQTSDFYRTDPNLPQRFNNPDSFQGYGVKKIHPLYRTWNQTYGSKTPTVHEMQTQFKVTSHRFSELQLQSGMYKDHGFNTALERSKVMVSTEIQNKRLQHLRHYGNQSKEHHHQNSITQ
ncbi:piercer of microtubule wall 2 protein [Fundulus diaphanus]